MVAIHDQVKPRIAPQIARFRGVLAHAQRVTLPSIGRRLACTNTPLNWPLDLRHPHTTGMAPAKQQPLSQWLRNESGLRLTSKLPDTNRRCVAQPSRKINAQAPDPHRSCANLNQAAQAVKSIRAKAPIGRISGWAVTGSFEPLSRHRVFKPHCRLPNECGGAARPQPTTKDPRRV